MTVAKDWLKKRKRDHYYRLAKKEKLHSRAAYKLLQINEELSVIKEGDKVVDLGCAPGGWSQVALELVGEPGKVVGVDLKGVRPIEGLTFVKGDATKPEIVDIIKNEIGEADAIISDMSPRISGNRVYDQARFLELCDMSLELSNALLKNRGNLVVKIFQGYLSDEFVERVKERFSSVRIFRPKASNAKSAEVYVVGKGFNAPRAR
jgi:23S rRNA (uridine2552-2'-O)-methyltransferase